MVAPVCVTWQVSRGWVGQARHCRQGKRLGPGVAGWALAATGLAGCWLELFVGAEVRLVQPNQPCPPTARPVLPPSPPKGKPTEESPVLVCCQFARAAPQHAAA